MLGFQNIRFEELGMIDISTESVNKHNDISFLPKVSVIVPVYNVEKYLSECLESLINQTLSDIEIICVNDGSTDDSRNVLERYAASDKRIAVVNQTNKGLSAARNSGVKTARGRYLYFLDSDDFIDRNALEYLYQEAEKYRLDILYFDGVSVWERSKFQSEIYAVDICVRNKEFGGTIRGGIVCGYE